MAWPHPGDRRRCPRRALIPGAPAGAALTVAEAR